MRAAAEKAIQLDPLLAEAHDALGMAHTRDGQWEQSERSFRRAIELDPGRSASYRHFATILLLPRPDRGVAPPVARRGKSRPACPGGSLLLGLRAHRGWPLR
jgi:tetratricopeptide (TPR) repeat protein